MLYFYSRTGTFQPTALLSFATLMRDWETPDFLAFTTVREKFETVLLGNRIIREVVGKLGAGQRSRPRIIGFYRAIISRLREGLSPDEVMADLRKTAEYKFLTEPPEEEMPLLQLEGGSFNREVKGAAYIASALPTAPKCPTCGGLIHRNGMQTGHKQAKREGGSGRIENAGPQHPLCNSTVSN